jgi:hypothetical protein
VYNVSYALTKFFGKKPVAEEVAGDREGEDTGREESWL